MAIIFQKLPEIFRGIFFKPMRIFLINQIHLKALIKIGIFDCNLFQDKGILSNFNILLIFHVKCISICKTFVPFVASRVSFDHGSYFSMLIISLISQSNNAG